VSLSNTVENEMLADFLTRHPTLFLALSSSDPGETGAGISEPAPEEYVRQPVGAVALTGSAIYLDDDIVFPGATQTWGTVAYVAMFSAEEGGTFLGSAAVESVNVGVGAVITVAAGTPVVTLD